MSAVPKGPHPAAAPKSARRPRLNGAPTWLFVLGVSYVVVLCAAALWYQHSSQLQDFLPPNLGPVPIGVPWWGALGAVTVSLGAMFAHRRDWDPSMETWHIARPILGAIAGAVGYLVFTALIRSTGTTTEVNNSTFYILAFILGYREMTFRELIKQATDLLLRPAGNADGERRAAAGPTAADGAAGTPAPGLDAAPDAPTDPTA